MKTLKYSILTSVVALCAASASAQPLPESALSTAEPGRVSEQLRNDNFTTTASPSITVSEGQEINAPAGADRISINLKGLNISGVSVYSADELAPTYNAQIGQTISLADVYGIANRLKLKYRNDGYLLAQVVVPPQTIDDGIINLQVVEGKVDSVVIEGDESAASGLIRRYANQMALGGALNAAQLERQLLMINDLPGVNARSVLSPSPNSVGAADLRIIVERDPFDALVGANNYGSRYLGPIQLSGAATLNNPLRLNDALTAQIVVAPDSYELGYFGLGYDVPVGSYGTKLKLFASHTDTEPGFDLTQFNVEGRSNFASIGVEHPFIRSRAQNLYGRVTFDWRDVKTSNNLPELTRRDSIRALRAGVKYDVLDTFMGVGVNAFDLAFSQGIGLFGASDKGDANLSRAAGDPNFFKVNLEAQRLQRITNSVNLLVAGQAQWADDPLLASEEFGIGGIGMGRGYDPSEVVGEKGIAGKVEVQWNEPVEFNIVPDYQLFGFFDTGRVWNDDPTTNAQKRDSISSTGFGIRTEFDHDINADFAVALPLTRDVGTQNDKDARFYFSLTKGF